MRPAILIPLLFTAACNATSPFAPAGSASAPQPGEPAVLVQLTDYQPGDVTASPRFRIDSAALSSNYLFFNVTGYGLYRMPKYGGAIELVDGDANAELAVANEHVFWVDSNGAIRTRAVAGGPITTVYQTQHLFRAGISESRAKWFAADDKYVYFVEVTGAQSDQRTLYRVPVAGGAPLALISASNNPSDEYFSSPTVAPSFLLAGGDVYYISANGLELDALRAGSSTPEKLVEWAAPDVVFELLAVDGDTIYLEPGWPSNSTDKVLSVLYTVPRSGGELTSVAMPEKSDVPIFAADATNIYFTQSDASHSVLLSMPKNGGPSRVISGNLAGNYSADLQDEKNIFFVRNEAELVMLPKTPIGILQ